MDYGTGSGHWAWGTGHWALGTGVTFTQVRRLRWSAAGTRLAVTADDAVVKVVEVGEESIVERYTDTR